MLASRLTFALALSAAACAVAQPASPPADPAQVPTAVARMLGAYRFGAIAERVSLTATDAQHQVTSDVTLRVDAGDPRTQRPRRLRLEMGRLVIYAQDDRLVAVHTQNDEQFFEATLAGGLTPASLASALPQIPLPQLGFALDPRPTEELAIEPAMQVTGAGLVTWSGAQPLGGAAADARVEFITNTDSRLTSYTITSPALTLSATVEPLDTPDAKRADLWAVDVSNRTPVARLTDLRPLPGDVAIGDRVPTLGMHRHDLSGWSLTDALRSLAEEPPKANAMTAAALICVLPGEQIPARNVLAARRALDNLSREFANQRQAGITTAPRLLVLSVGVLELDQIAPAFIRDTRQQLGAISEDTPLFLWTSAGRATLRRIAPGTTRAAVLIIDSEHRLRAVLPLDNTLTDEMTIAREVRAIVSERLIEESEQKPGDADQLKGSGDSEEK
jgi:hypothetical protein